MTVNHDVAGSNPASGASGLFVKRLRHRPFTAGSGVRIPHRSPWAISSAGRASALQAECQQFDPVIAHHNEKFHVPCAVGFFIAFFPSTSFVIQPPASALTIICASLRSFKMCSLRNQFDPVIAHHNEKFHVLCAVGFFIAFFVEKCLVVKLKDQEISDVRCLMSLSLQQASSHFVILSEGTRRM